MITVATRFSCCSTRYYLLGIQDSMCSREAFQIKELLPQSDLRPLALSLCAGGKRRMSTAAGGRQIKYSLITLHILKCLGEEITSLFGFYCAVQRQNHFFLLYVILIILSVQLLGKNIVLLCTTNQISHFQSFYKSCSSQHQNM